MDCIYLDNNATTPLLPGVAEAMLPYQTQLFGNPASSHLAGRRARQALEESRERLAALLDAHPDEVVFTSGATEANNLALAGLSGDAPAHLITSPTEHPSVLEPLRRLSSQGFALTLLPVDHHGLIDPATLEQALRPDTRLISIMLANHETGALQPVGQLVEAAAGRALFHCDAVQAVGKIPFSFARLGVSTLSLSGHKLHGPKGIGALLVRRQAPLRPLLWGGHQQRGRRPGTEPVALAVGLAAALELACREQEQRQRHIQRLRQCFLAGLQPAACPFAINGPPDGLAHTLNVSFPGVKADLLLMSLDLAGVACATGSACSSGSLLPSPVLQAMHVPPDVLHSAMRISFSALLSVAEVEEAARRVAGAVQRLRQECEP
jgi:cysteine desulfurase